jgi:Nickel/cobalt transporter regulator
MAKRNALLVAIVMVLLLAGLSLWPELVRAESSVSARIGVGFGGHHGGFRGGFHGGIKGGHSGGLRGGFRGGRTFGGRDAGDHASFGHRRGSSKHGLLIGDRFRFKTLRHIDREHGRRSRHLGRGGRHFGGGFGHIGTIGLGRFHLKRRALLGDRFRGDTIRRALHENRRERHRGRPHRDSDGHDAHDFGGHDSKGRDFDAREFRAAAFHRRGWRGHRGWHAGKWLSPWPLVLTYDDPDVIVREVIIPVPIPAARPPEAAAERQRALDPRGRVALVGEGEGIVGDWAAGDVLPHGIPHVTLDPVAYGLPEPPPGQKYVRVGNDVLRIETGSRRIAEVVPR